MPTVVDRAHPSPQHPEASLDFKLLDLAVTPGQKQQILIGPNNPSSLLRNSESDSARVCDFDFRPAFWDSSKNGYRGGVRGLTKEFLAEARFRLGFVSSLDAW